MEPCDISHKICVINNFVHEEFAKYVRDFVLSVPFDINTSRLNDTDNQPKTNVYDSLKLGDGITILDKYKGHTYREYNNSEQEDANQWTWENYKFGIWRIAPLSATAYINSPIYDLINIIFWKLDKSIKESLKEKLFVGTVVLQRVPTNNYITRHIDNCGTRRASFIYYLTPDDWSESDGG